MRKYSTKGRILSQEMLMVGLVSCFILLAAEESLAQAVAHDGPNSEACTRLLALLAGRFGALVTIAVGVGAIIGSKIGRMIAARAKDGKVSGQRGPSRRCVRAAPHPVQANKGIPATLPQAGLSQLN